ncbi:hypothetical protein [uncultured Helicobacter sp.]|uniref:hypothetical protein n=1 Tax=uncultured Helicobacter sp. TaxID=175537 RepID=UPI002616C70E|nr:hypothetical protein [uncultured Helicobacter sp.]
MKHFFVFLLFILFTHAQEITFSQKLKTLQITIPIQEKIATTDHKDFLQITLPSMLVQKEQTQTLLPPFEKIQILPTSSQQTQITIWGKNLSLTQTNTNQAMILEIKSEVLKVSWWNYLYVCLILGAMIVFLRYLKNKTKQNAKNKNYQEILLSAKSKIISFEYENTKYLIFSNEKGNLLLNHYPKETHNKDFTHLISED